ncbi:hypothetical protein NCCNTM_06820 [Mycolicibacterium sp. NCC-Tsukiji]|nr:hypothetical protein NCCNTM_06820 [Mycolicibacterium sp. NCC-Tsukiji]
MIVVIGRLPVGTVVAMVGPVGVMDVGGASELVNVVDVGMGPLVLDGWV